MPGSYTNEGTVDITGTVPLTVIGDDTLSISLYQTLQGQKPTLIQDGIPIPNTAAFTIPAVKLVKGSNVFTARIAGEGGLGPASAPITYVLDTAKPKLTITAPKAGGKVNGASVAVTGKTQASLRTLLAQNSTIHTSSTTTAERQKGHSRDGGHPGSNTSTCSATDPASNSETATVTVTRGSGKLTMGLSSSQYSFSSKRGATLTFRATLVDPNGKSISGHAVAFTVTLAGVPPDIQIRTTNSAGVATLKETIGAHAADLGVGKSGTVTASADTKSGHIQKTVAISTAK
jgi:hypothetical protein